MREGVRGDDMKSKFLTVLLGAGLLLAPTGVALASGGGGHEGGLNWFDFALRTLNFAILLAILIKLLKKPIGSFFTSRKDDIRAMLAELEDKKLEAERTAAQYRGKMADLEGETQKIVSELLAEGEAERKKIVESAGRQAQYIQQQAQIAIQQEVKVAKEKLQEEIAEMSVAAAEEILRQNMQADDQHRLVQDFVARVTEVNRSQGKLIEV